MPRDRGGRTFRVRQIPSNANKDTLAGLLVNLCHGLGPEQNIVTCSLASSLVPFETPRTKTATIVFKTLPEVFDSDDTEWVLRTDDTQPNVIVDVHFRGFTALNDVDSDLHVLDCISISGLASHPFGSWAERNPQSNFMWLRDRLPHDLKHVRSIIYGYDSRLVQSESFQGIDDIAITFIAQLKSIGRSLKAARPAVVLAHSLGGIILKCALLEMANSGDVEKYMLNSIREVIFFGVPNRGMEMEQWLPMVKGQPNERLIRLLAPGSQYLIDLDERFNGISNVRNLRLVSFYETQRSQTAERNQPKGKWEISGPFKVLVDKKSAVQRGSHKADIIPIDKSHSDMVKLREGSEEYQIVARYIHELVKSVHDHPSGSLRTDNHDGVLSGQLPPSAPAPAEVNTDLAYSVVHSLDLSDTRYRFERIEEAYGPTFEWIWTDLDVGFVSWLKSGTGTYWISGKPGSGKSTLMKYIFKNYQEMVLQKSGSSDRTHIPAGFFFHNRGSHLQKSFEGLLYSILHQVLTSERGLINEVLPIYLRHPERHRAQWPLENLEEALSCILKQSRLPVDILLFLDALDEYGGRPDFIVDFIMRMIDTPKNSATRIKICFSSRLWNVFIDQFRECPGFKIHERTKEDILAYISGKFNSSPSMAQLLSQESDTKDRGIVTLISGLVERAEGVFLWLKLVIDELLNAVREGAIVAELMEILSSFPKELEELYTELIKRIPAEFRMESYAMLEIVLRSDIRIYAYDFWLASACAPCRTLEDCISKIPLKALVAPYQIGNKWPATEEEFDPTVRNTFYTRLDKAIGGNEQYQRRLKSRCGGLIEEVPVQNEDGELNGTIIQFMHQTVKDFVSKPGFRQLITNENHQIKENGYSFLAKYGLAQLTLERRRFTIPGYSSLPEYAPFSPNWFLYLWYASKAESSTGTSLKHLLDAASEAFMLARNEHDVYGLFGSAVSFGVVANLQLYVQECNALRRLMGHGDSKTSTLLHDVVRAIIDPESLLPKSLVITRQRGPLRVANLPSDIDVTFHDLSIMTNILLDAGANRASTYHGKTPFQMLFQQSYEGYGKGYGEGSNSESPQVIETATAFLQRGQDPNTDILVESRSYSGHSVICKPLHLAASPLAQILLDYGADVNALDGNGFTPLDVALGSVGNIYEIGDLIRPEEGYRLPLLLLDHGGCVTGAGASSIQRFLEALTRHDGYSLDSLDDRLKNPPRLQTPTVMARLANHLNAGNNSGSSTLSSQASDASKSSRFQRALPRLFKRKVP